MSRRLTLLGAVLIVVAACSSSGGAAADPSTAAAVQPSVAAPAEALTSSAVVEAFAAAGLEADSPSPMTVKDFGLAPKRTDDGTHFLVPSLGEGSGGRAMVFSNVDDLRATKAYYDDLGKSSAAFFSWTFANEPALVLVQINGELPKDKAEAYKKVVDEIP